MTCQQAVYQWATVVATQLPQLSKPQATVLALWSVGMVLARSCALPAVRSFLAAGLERKENSVRQQLREWCYEAKAKRGEGVSNSNGRSPQRVKERRERNVFP